MSSDSSVLKALRACVTPGTESCFRPDMANKEYVGAVDQGTTSTRFIVFDLDGQPVVSHQLEHKQYYPKSGWVEHDPMGTYRLFVSSVNVVPAARSILFVW